MGPEQANQPRSLVPTETAVQTGVGSVAVSETVQASPKASQPSADATIIEWEASEAVHHQKDVIWYGALMVVGLLLAVLSIFLLKSWTFTILIVVMVASVIFLNVRPPRVLHYRLGSSGLTINQKQYAFRDFRAFGIMQDGPLYYIVLLPVKRLMPSIDVYFPAEQGERIVDTLGAHIPMKTLKPDFVDELTKRLRF